MNKHSMNSLFVAIIFAFSLVAASCSSADTDASGENTTTTFATGVVYRYVIPEGTGEAIDRGEVVDLMPSELEIKVGDAIEIVNNDTRGHNVGMFFVREGETVNQVFPSVADFSDVCSINESGQFTINVTA